MLFFKWLQASAFKNKDSFKKKFSFCLSYASDMKFVNEEQTQPYVFLCFSSLFTTRNVYIYFGVDMFIGQPSLSLIKFLK